MTSAAGDAVFEYLKKQNRPYSAVDILNNLHKEHGKTAIQKMLDTLVGLNKIREKVYGKQKVYVVNQDCFDDTALQSNINELDAKLSALKEKFSVCSKLFRGSETNLSILTSTLTTDEAKNIVVHVNKQVSKLDETLRTAKKNTQNELKQVTPEEMLMVEKEREKYSKEWRKRKRIANEMIDSVLDGFPNGKKMLFEELGIETDENVGVKMV